MSVPMKYIQGLEENNDITQVQAGFDPNHNQAGVVVSYKDGRQVFVAMTQEGYALFLLGAGEVGKRLCDSLGIDVDEPESERVINNKDMN